MRLTAAARAARGMVTSTHHQAVVAGGRPSAPTAELTLGVEEEFVLADASTGRVALVAGEVLRLLNGEPWVQPELMRFQIETATKVCTTLAEVRAELDMHRRAAASVAERLGCRLLASGTAPFGAPALRAVTNNRRYRALASRFPACTATGGTCACHVHVAVPSRDIGTHVLARLRPWLASLLAISVNSPIADGRDTGWASWRYPLWSRWPTMRPPEVWPSAAAYDATVRELLRRGTALDEPSVYFQARLSPRYPTVEVRIADACLDVDDAVLLAGLVRALVATAIGQARRGEPVQAAPTGSVRAAVLAAARQGLSGVCVDPTWEDVVTQRKLLDRLVDRVHGALEAGGDDGEVEALLHRLDARGTGAARQRVLWARATSPGEFTQALARATVGSPVRPEA